MQQTLIDGVIERSRNVVVGCAKLLRNALANQAPVAGPDPKATMSAPTTSNYLPHKIAGNSLSLWLIYPDVFSYRNDVYPLNFIRGTLEVWRLRLVAMIGSMSIGTHCTLN